MDTVTAEINDRVVAALFSEVKAHEAYAAIPFIVQTLYGLSEHSIDTPAETLLRLLSGLGLDTANKVIRFLSADYIAETCSGDADDRQAHPHHLACAPAGSETTRGSGWDSATGCETCGLLLSAEA